MPGTAQLCLVLLGIGVLALVLVAAASPWLCRVRIDRPALDAAAAALRATQTADRRASDHKAA